MSLLVKITYETFEAIQIASYVLLLASVTLCSAFYFLRSLHMFQLNMYDSNTQYKWFYKNKRWILLNFAVPAAVSFLVILILSRLVNYPEGQLMRYFSYIDAYYHLDSIAVNLGISVVWIVSAFLFGKAKAKPKKPIVFTPRVIRMCVTAGILYLLGFILYYGALPYVYMVSSYLSPYLFALAIPFSLLLPLLACFVNAPFEERNNQRYILQAEGIINSMPNLITIGITGSYGKTSTKYYLQKLLSVKYSTLMTPESFNTTLGVVKTVRNQLRPTHEVFICEMGMKWKGDIEEICHIVKPRHAMLTSIGPQHLETMGTIENIIEEKFSITDTITDGNCFLNYDNEYIRERPLQKNIIRYGVYEQNADYRAENISVSEKGTSFTICIGDERQEFRTALIGSHNVQNIVGAIAVAHTLGIKLQELILPVKRLECAPHRLQIKSHGNTVIIDDSFNSNPVGAKAALDTLKLFEGTKILITPGMVELGDELHRLNKAFGAQAADSADYALLIGERQAPPIKEGLLEAGFAQDRIHIFDSFNEGMAFANALNENKKIILIENDLPDNF